jgi:hypothetical protein
VRYKLIKRTKSINGPSYRIRLFATLEECRLEALGSPHEFLIENEDE